MLGRFLATAMAARISAWRESITLSVLTVYCTANYLQARVIESLMQAIRGAAFAIPGALGVQEGGLVAMRIFGFASPGCYRCR